MLRTVALDTPRLIALDERLAADRRGGRDVFLDDGPKDRLGAKVQGAEWAASSTRQGLSPAVVSTLWVRVLTVCRHRSSREVRVSTRERPPVDDAERVDAVKDSSGVDRSRCVLDGAGRGRSRPVHASLRRHRPAADGAASSRDRSRPASCADRRPRSDRQTPTAAGRARAAEDLPHADLRVCGHVGNPEHVRLPRLRSDRSPDRGRPDRHHGPAGARVPHGPDGHRHPRARRPGGPHLRRRPE